MSELRNIRRIRGLTLAAVAEKIGVTEATMSRYETMPEKLNLPLMKRLADALECRVSDIVGETRFATASGQGPEAGTSDAKANIRSREAIKEELRAIDSLSIRLLREFAVTLSGAPERLRRLDSHAADLRQELEASL